jgi:hypothetical protein
MRFAKPRHSGVGRNPVPLFNMQLAFARYAEFLFLLDSGLRRNDGFIKGRR